MTEIQTGNPGKAHRKSMSLTQLFCKWPDNAAAEQWFIQQRWPNGITCPHCGSTNVQTGARHKTMPYRCRDKECGKRFSTRTGTVMEASKLGYQIWIVATYFLTTSLKGVCSMKLHRDLEINHRSAWFLAHRLRTALEANGNTNRGSGLFGGPVEIDEAPMGGKRRNKSNAQRKEATVRAAAGKTVVIGAKDQETNQVTTRTVPDTTRETLRGLVADMAAEGVRVCADDLSGNESFPDPHETVNHSSRRYVDGLIHANGIELFRSMFMRAHEGTCLKMLPGHLGRHITEFAAHQNLLEKDKVAFLAAVARGGIVKRPKYRRLIANNRPDSGAQS
ncbi:MAG: IS1595 family transposase [Rhodobacteraceae bacterium]|nr:IS1595 family transposase [Paracoccaceae bacterium]